MKKSNERALCVPLLKKTKRIMKLTTLFSLGVACCISASTYAQGYKLSMNKQNSSIIEILKDIEKNSEFTFFFNDNKVNVNKKASINVKDATLDEALAQVLKNTDYGYQIIDRQVLIKTAPSPVSSVPGIQQNQKAIAGIIKDVNGEPIIGANVVEKGTTNGTVTDIEGRFSLNVALGATLVVSYIGYTTTVLKASDKKNLMVKLYEDTKKLDEVVVVGYGVQKKKLVTGATVQVKGDEIAKMNTTNPLQAMQGQTPGVSIASTSGQPGADMKVSIRGLGTVGNSAPLYLIDGVGGDISTLNPADIESIDVLKDAASAAIYGSAGANGVVLITTKQGREGKAQISFDAYYGIQNVARKANMLNAKEYMAIMDEQALNSGLSAYDWSQYQSIYDANGNVYDTDWVDTMFKDNATTESYTLGVTGGSATSTYALSLGYMSQEGIVGGSDVSNYSRYNFRVNSEHKLFKDILKVGEQVSFVQPKKVVKSQTPRRAG